MSSAVWFGYPREPRLVAGASLEMYKLPIKPVTPCVYAEA